MPLGTSQYQQSFPSVLPFMDVWRRAQQQRNRSIGLILEFNGGLEVADTTIRIEDVFLVFGKECPQVIVHYFLNIEFPLRDDTPVAEQDGRFFAILSQV